MRSRLLPFCMCLLSLGFLAVRLQAQFYWDINGPTAGAGGIAPTGTWDGSSNNWSGSSLGTATTTVWSGGSVAVFSAGSDATGAYAVTVSGTQVIGGLTIEEGTPSFTGGSLSFTAATSFTLTTDATIASALVGSGGTLFKFGNGALSLNGANTYTGGTNLVAGSINLTGSVSHAATDFIVNGSGTPTATLNITGGGDLTADRLRIGVTNNTFSGAVLVDGAGSTVTNTSYVYVGEAGTGDLTIANGGAVAGPNTSIGNNATGVGRVSVTGAGSTLVNTATLYVGSGGDGRLDVDSGGVVTNLNGVVGNNPGGLGAVSVDGSGSTWTNTGSLLVGSATAGSLDIINNGSVTALNAGIGQLSGVSGSVSVYYDGSFSTTGNLTIGAAGDGLMNLGFGGDAVTGGNVVMANAVGSTGSANLVGAGTTWSVAGSMIIGNSGTGFLQITDSAVLNSTGGLTLGQSGGSGSLSIGYDGEGYSNNMILNVPSITTGTGTGTVLLGTSATKGIPFYLTRNGTSGGTYVTIAGPTLVTQQLGYNFLGGTNTYSGGTLITGGTLVAASSGALGSGTVTVSGAELSLASGVTVTNALTLSTGSVLSGNGTFGTNVTIGAGHTLAPGNSVGTLGFSSGLTLAPGGTFDLEVQLANGAPGTGYDLLSISGAPLDITASSGSPFTLRLISLNGLGSLGNVSDFSSASPYSWTIATSAAGITGFAANNFTFSLANFTNSLDGGSFSVAQSGNNLLLNFTPVPEPSTYALMLAGLGLAGFRAWRKRRAA